MRERERDMGDIERGVGMTEIGLGEIESERERER